MLGKLMQPPLVEPLLSPFTENNIKIACPLASDDNSPNPTTFIEAKLVSLLFGETGRGEVHD